MAVNGIAAQRIEELADEFQEAKWTDRFHEHEALRRRDLERWNDRLPTLCLNDLTEGCRADFVLWLAGLRPGEAERC